VKRAGIHDKTQEMAQQRRLLDSVLSNCTFDRGSVCPTYKEPFDRSVRPGELENGGPYGTSFATGAQDYTGFQRTIEIQTVAAAAVNSSGHRTM
jgi:hypothetical protein